MSAGKQLLDLCICMKVRWGKREVAGYWEYEKDVGLMVKKWRKFT